jgi:hypothetical protein
MIDFDNKELMHARGCLSTLNSERRQLLKQLTTMLDKVVGMPNRILQGAQEAPTAVDYDARALVADLASTARLMDATLARIEELDKQRKELRAVAWPK